MLASLTTGVRRHKRRGRFELVSLLSARLISGTTFEATFTDDVTLIGPGVDGASVAVDSVFNLLAVDWIAQTGPRTLTFSSDPPAPDVSVVAFIPAPINVSCVLGFATNMAVGVVL